MPVQFPPAVDAATLGHLKDDPYLGRLKDNLNFGRLKDDLYKDGICSIKGAFSREWTQRLRDDYEPLMHEARAQHRGTISRGHNRFYHAVQVERLSGFLDLVTHPAFTGVAEAVLGPDYYIVEFGFDVPLPGAKDQPWHRDFPIGNETLVGRWYSSLCFNLTTVDVTEEMGAFEIAPGTQWEEGKEFADGMFPPKETYDRYKSMSRRAYPKMGDMSCRTGLAIHRGTQHDAAIPRPVLIVGVVAACIQPYNPHKMQMSKQFYEKLPPAVQARLSVKLTDGLQPIEQAHEIEGLRY
jgi:hypothetical protein